MTSWKGRRGVIMTAWWVSEDGGDDDHKVMMTTWWSEDGGDDDCRVESVRVEVMMTAGWSQ